MSISETNKQIADYRKEIAELSIPILELESKIKELKDSRKPLILKGKFKWGNKTYKVSDIHIYRNYYYDDCPYTPGYNFCGETIEFRQEGEQIYSRVILSKIDRNIGDFEKHKADYDKFIAFFEKKFGESVYSIIKKEDNKQ